MFSDFQAERILMLEEELKKKRQEICRLKKSRQRYKVCYTETKNQLRKSQTQESRLSCRYGNRGRKIDALRKRVKVRDRIIAENTKVVMRKDALIRESRRVSAMWENRAKQWRDKAEGKTHVVV